MYRIGTEVEDMLTHRHPNDDLSYFPLCLLSLSSHNCSVQLPTIYRSSDRGLFPRRKMCLPHDSDANTSSKERKQKTGMLTNLTDTLTTLITHFYVSTGLFGVILAMAIESCCIPLPSEIVMPVAGILIARSLLLPGMNALVGLVIVALAGSLGCLIGSSIAYGIGYAGGQPLLLRYGRYVLISQHDAEKANRFFQRWGSATAFFSRLLPVIRTYISLPAGITRMPFGRFCIYTVLGSFPWCLVLGYLGFLLGNHLESLSPIFHGLDAIIVIAVALLVIVYLYRHIRNDRKARAHL